MTDAEKTLRCFLDKFLDEKGYNQDGVEIKEIPLQGDSYTSALFSIKIKTSDKNLKLFAKVAIMGKDMRAVLNAEKLFITESFVYNKLTHLYNNLQKYLDEEHKFIFPKFYALSDELYKETVIMENLTENGYKSYDRFKSMDWNHGRVSVEALARFHALSFALNKSDPEGFQKIAMDMAYSLNTSDVPDQTVIDHFLEIVDKASKILNPDHRIKVQKFMYREDLYKKFKQPIGTPVLCHGDYRLSNLLFKRKGHDLKVQVVDYQTVHSGCPAADLLYFIFLGSDEKFRHLFYDKLINYYYESLAEALNRLSIDAVEVYPREKFDSDLKESLPDVVLIAVTVLPLVIAEAKAVPNWQTENADLSVVAVEPGDLYKQRFKGIINDLVRWGVI